MRILVAWDNPNEAELLHMYLSVGGENEVSLCGDRVELLKLAAEVVKIGDWHLLKENGPLWYRGYAAAPEAALREPVAAFFARNDISRIVVGHTPTTERRIVVRLGGSIVVIDTGMLATAYKGRASALEIAGTQLTAIYTDARVPLETRPSAALARQGERE